jgi:hypothetical protein
MRIIIAGILGGIAMFVWSTIAHMATPLGAIGISQMPAEAPMLSAMQTSIGTQSGLYFFPWVDTNAPDAMAKSAAAMKVNPSGILLYHPPGANPNMAPLMVAEFAKETVMALIAAWLLSLTVIASFGLRVVFVTAVGIAASISTSVSYLIWYGFPLDYTLSYMTIEILQMFFAGIVIAWWFGRRRTVPAV